MLGNIFIKKKEEESLHSFHESFCRTIRVAVGQMRDSENYVGGAYYRVDALGFRIKIAEADDNELPEYDFWITFRCRIDDISIDSIMEGVGDIVAKELALAGYSVLRVSPMPQKPGSNRTRRKCVVNSSGTRAELVEV